MHFEWVQLFLESSFFYKKGAEQALWQQLQYIYIYIYIFIFIFIYILNGCIWDARYFQAISLECVQHVLITSELPQTQCGRDMCTAAHAWCRSSYVQHKKCFEAFCSKKDLLLGGSVSCLFPSAPPTVGKKGEEKYCHVIDVLTHSSAGRKSMVPNKHVILVQRPNVLTWQECCVLFLLLV